MLKEFKKFVLRGNVMDLAVAVIIGGAFGKIVSSFVNDVLMPLLGLLLGKVDFTALKIVLVAAQGDSPEVAVLYGQFIQNIIDFTLIALAIFMMIKLIEKTKKKPEPAPAEPSAPAEDIVLLTEIRDLLKQQS